MFGPENVEKSKTDQELFEEAGIDISKEGIDEARKEALTILEDQEKATQEKKERDKETVEKLSGSKIENLNAEVQEKRTEVRDAETGKGFNK